MAATNWKKKQVIIPANSHVDLPHGFSGLNSEFDVIASPVPSVEGRTAWEGVSVVGGGGLLNVRLYNANNSQRVVDVMLMHSSSMTTTDSIRTSNSSIYPIPTSLVVGKKVHYYPLPTDPNPYASPGGLPVTIHKVIDALNIQLEYSGSVITATKSGYNGTKRFDKGTWEPLDFRHRRHLRLHGTHCLTFFNNLKNDPSLFDFWLEKGIDWHNVPIDAIVQPHPDIDGYLDLFDRLADTALEVGVLMNFGLLTVSSFTATSDWWDISKWRVYAEKLDLYWSLLKGRVDGWLHLQMETTEDPAQALTQHWLDLAGVSRDQFKTAFQPFLDSVTATGLRTIVRPFNDGEVAMPMVIAASAPGSVYCNEIGTVFSKQMRLGENQAYQYQGEHLSVLNSLASQMPPDASYAPLRVEGELRSAGARLLEDYRAAAPTYGPLELVELTEGWVTGSAENGPFPAPAYIPMRSWYEMTSKSKSGTTTPSMNDVVACWPVVSGTNGCRSTMCLGSARGTARQLTIDPWKRSGSSDITDTTISVDPSGWRADTTGSYARGFRIHPTIWTNPSSSQLETQFTWAFSFNLPPVAPSGGVVYGVFGNTQNNSVAGGFNIIDDGQLKLTIQQTVGSASYVLDATPNRSGSIKLIIGNSGSIWLADRLGYITASNARTASGLAVTFGFTHPIVGASTTIYHCSGGYVPYDSQILFWKRMLTAEEATCFKTTAKWPFGYEYF